MSLRDAVGATIRAPRAVTTTAAAVVGSAVSPVLGTLGTGRRHRRVWASRGRAHIEIRGVRRSGQDDLVRHFESALREVRGVHWAQVNAVLGRVVVVFDPDDAGVDDLLDVVRGVEDAYDVRQERFAHDEPEHPGDLEPIRRNLVAIGADAAGLGASLLGQALRLSPFPAELASVVSIAESEPRIRHLLENHLGTPTTDLGLGLASAFVQAISQGPLGLVADMTYRTNLVTELVARRSAFSRREAELCCEGAGTSLQAPARRARPVPLPAGPVERYADGAALGSIGAFGLALGLTGSPRRAASVLVAGVPKAARHGREAFAAQLGRELARRGVVVMDGGALRRLDRIDTVVLDAGSVLTGRTVLGSPHPLYGTPAERSRAQEQLSILFDPWDPERVVRRGGWTVGPLSELRALSIEVPRRRPSETPAMPGPRVGARDRKVVGIARSGVVLATAPLEDEVDPLLDPLVEAVRRGGVELVVAALGQGPERAVAERIGPDRSVPGGRRTAASVRMLQAEGRAVLLIAGSRSISALAAADCAVGLAGDHHTHPWSADLITCSGLADAHLVVEAIPAARSVSQRSSMVAVAGSGTGAAWAVLGRAPGAARRASLPMNAAALVAQGQGILAAAELGRRPAPSPAPRTPWHTMEPGAVLRALNTSQRGLEAVEAGRRREHRGSPPPVAVRTIRAIGAELSNPLTPVMIVGSGLAAAVGSVGDAALVAGVTGVNAVIGAAQRMAAEVSIDRLLQVGTTSVAIRRGGEPLMIERDGLVRGDVVSFSAGDVIPADCRILDADRCEADESALTGESLPVGKSAATLTSIGLSLAERSCMLYEGSTIANGTALAVVVATGAHTELGQSLADAPEPPPSGVEARLGALTAVIVPAVVASGAAVTGMSLLRGRGVRQAVTSGVSLMVAAVPEGLPLLATVAQVGAAQRLSGRGALVRNPRTIEALGRVDTLCFDKTGTLTVGEITLQRVSDGEHDEPVDALGPGGRRVLAAGMRASPELRASGTSPVRHATDRAVLHGGGVTGVAPGEGLGGWRVRGELPFDPARGFHAVIGTSPRGPRVSVKGAPEIILPRCTSWATSDGPVTIDRRARRRLDAEVERLAGRGLRVLAVAERRAASSRPQIGDERVADMQLLGFLGMADSVRPTAAAAVADLRAAGIQVVMITGDHPATASVIAEELEIADGKRTLAGGALDALTDEELDRTLPGVSVFARVTPSQKVRIVRAYQRIGRVVAMTGDGANDAPAIRLANTGIALAGRGSAGAREAADVVIADDRIETILDAVLEGRALWASVRDALAILVGGNLGEVAFTLFATAVSGQAPLGARQFLLVNLLTDMLPAMTIALRPPANRSPQLLLHEGVDSSLGSALVRQVALRAVTTAGGAGGAWLIARPGGSRRRASTVALVALVGTQLAQTAVVGGRSPVVLGSTVLSMGALAAVVQTPGLSHFFGCTPLGPLGWGIAGGASAAATGASVVVPWAAERVSRARRDRLDEGRALSPPAADDPPSP